MPPRSEWRWGDEEPASGEPPTPLLDDQTPELVAEAELMLATGRTVEEVAELLKRQSQAGGSSEPKPGPAQEGSNYSEGDG